MLKKKKQKKDLKVFDLQGNICNSDKQKVDILTDHFNNIFHKDDQELPENYPPSTNNPPFHQEEIKKAVHKLKNGKSPGIDYITAEMLKNSPGEIHDLIADILNTSVETEDSLSILKIGILI